MGVSLRSQGVSLLLALTAGVGLGILYDLLRPLRRRCGDMLWDLLFCAAAAFLCFCLAMRSGSAALGTGELAASLLGLLGYFSLMSPLVLPIFENSVSRIGVFSNKALIAEKKIRK